jgi:O-antigen/teichoic acid export membrane protein
MFSFGSKLLASGLIDTLWGNMYNIVVGKVINPSALGIYNRAESFATFPSSNIYGLVQGVSYPTLCSLQDDKERLREAFRKYIRMFAYITFPMMIGLAVVADPFIRVILKDNWVECIPYLQIMCLALMWYPLDAMNITFPNVLGHSEYYLRLVIVNKAISLITLIITIPFGLKVMCFGQLFSYVLFLFINSFYTGKLIGYHVLWQLRDILPTLGISLMMGIAVTLVCKLFPAPWVKLLAGIASGALFYWGVSVLFKPEEYVFLLDIVKQKSCRWKNS